MLTCSKSFEANWKFFVIVLVPIILIFIPFLPIGQLKEGSVTTTESKCLYVMAIMILYWVLDVMPLVVTALIPLAIIPLFGIVDGRDIAKTYMREPTMLVFGAVMIGCAFLASNLHKRMALKILSCTGNSTLRIVSAVFLSTLFLSMFITSVAASLIMVATTISLVEYREIVEIVDEGRLDSKTDVREREESATMELRKSGEVDQAYGSNPVDRAASYASATSSDAREQILESEHPSDNIVKEASGLEVKETAPTTLVLVKEPQSTEMKLNISERDVIDRKLKKQFFIAIYVAANIGGLFLPHDTAAGNILYDWADRRKNKFIMGKKQIDTSMALTLWKNDKWTELTTGKWILYILPTLIVLSGIAWFYLSVVFTHLSPVIPETTSLFSKKKPEENQILFREKEYYTGKYVKLGKFTFHQVSVIILTVCVFLLWFFRDPRSFTGWARIIPDQGGKPIKVKAGYSAPAILIVTIMFMIPRFGASNPKDKTPALLGWKFLETQVLWNLLLLMGGCFALAECIHKSGLSIIALEWFNDMAKSSSTSSTMIHMACISLSLIMSELASGITSVNSIVQVFVMISRFHTTLGSVGLPVTVMSILSFMLPVATPSNALVFTAAGGDLKVWDMIKYGFLLDLASWLVVVIVDIAYGTFIFDRL